MYFDNGAPPSNASLAHATTFGWSRFCASSANVIACCAISDSHGFDSPLMIADCKLQIVNCINLQFTIYNLQSGVVWLRPVESTSAIRCLNPTGANRTTNAK